MARPHRKGWRKATVVNIGDCIMIDAGGHTHVLTTGGQRELAELCLKENDVFWCKAEATTLQKATQ